LFQEFIIDTYTQIEKCRLDYIRFNQQAIRVETHVETHRGFADATNADIDLEQIGMPTVLPSTFIGGLQKYVREISRFDGRSPLDIKT
jgi:hypothetical protein